MNTRTKLFSVLGLSLALLGSLGASALADKEGKEMTGAKIGEAAPAWTLTDIKGKEWKSTDFANKILVIDWVNPECPVCRGAHKDGRIPNMIKELKEMDVAFITVNSTHNTNAEKNEAALKGYGVEYPVLLDLDGSVGKLFGARTTPHLFVIDTAGVLRYQGALDDNARGDKEGDAVTNYAINAVKQIKAGETVSPETTKSYGCSVKYAKRQDGEKNKNKN